MAHYVWKFSVAISTFRSIQQCHGISFAPYQNQSTYILLIIGYIKTRKFKVNCFCSSGTTNAHYFEYNSYMYVHCISRTQLLSHKSGLCGFCLLSFTLFFFKTIVTRNRGKILANKKQMVHTIHCALISRK